MTERRRAHPSANHQDHDRLLIVRLAGDDLYPGEAEAARTLTRECAGCAVLAEELRAMTTALATLPVPRRSRDFRISDEQARSLRGSWLQRAMRRIASPGMGVMQPLAGAVMSIGIVLAVAGATLPAPVAAPSTEREVLFQAVTAPTQPAAAAGPTSVPEAAAPGAPTTTFDREQVPAEGAMPTEAAAGYGGSAAPAPVGPVMEGPATARATGAAGPVEVDAGPESEPGSVDAGNELPEGSPRTLTGVGDDANETLRPDRLGAERQELRARGGTDAQPGQLLVAIGAVLAMLGLLLVGLRSVARRATADRLLR